MKQNDTNGHDRLRQLYAAYGADPARWPEHERWRYCDTPPPELVEEHKDAHLIDRLLARHAVPPTPVQDHRQLIAGAAAAPRRDDHHAAAVGAQRKPHVRVQDAGSLKPWRRNADDRDPPVQRIRRALVTLVGKGAKQRGEPNLRLFIAFAVTAMTGRK